MFIQIAPKAKVYVTDADMDFIKSHWNQTFRNNQLSLQDQDRVKKLADKAIFVRKKLDTDIQFALNRKIRIVRNDSKK